jgi:DNA-directed RNA polymerase specialized sigma24 family protein
MMPDLDQLYDAYAVDKAPERLDELLTGVRSTVVRRYQKRYNRDVEDIAQQVVIRLWRMLEGSGLKPFDRARGRFNPYLSCMARTMVIDHFKYDRLVPTDDCTLETMAVNRTTN